MRNQLLQPLELGFLVDYVNAYAAEPRLRSGEDQTPYPAIATVAKGMPIALGLVRTIDRNGFQVQAVQLADRLHEVFATARSSPDQAVSSINALLDESGVAPHISRHAGRTIADWHVEVGRRSGDGELTALQSSCALALHDWLTGPGSLDRLGVCSAHQCADIYVDGSQAASRRYCSTACGTRTKVAAFRARAREQSRPTSSNRRR